MKKKRESSRNRTERPSEPDNPNFDVFEHPFSRLDKDSLREVLVSKGRESAEKFPKALEAILSRFRRWHPLHFIATVATYGSQLGVTDEGVSSDTLLKDMQQHHFELLQALVLTLPYAEWGDEPAPPHVIQEVIDQTKELAGAFPNRRLVAMEQERSDEERVVLALQERLRSHTQIVRNWGYFSAVVRISKELYGALDQRFLMHFGFGGTDLVEVSNAVLTVLQSRANSRFKVLGEIFRADTKEDLVRRYLANYPDVDGDPEQFLANIPADVTTEMVRFRLLAHADIALVKLATVNLDEISAMTARPRTLVEQVLGKMSLTPGSLDAEKVESFFLNNPVWTAPGVRVEGEYWFPAPQIIFSHIHLVMAALANEAGLKEQLEKQRSEYLERRISEVVGAAFPEAKLFSNMKWKFDGRVFETDLLCLVDGVALIVEAKSAALTPQGLRGAPDRVRRHVRELVVEPAEQSYRLERIILQAKAGDLGSREIVSGLGLDADELDVVVRVSVTLDDFSPVCNAERELRAAGWSPTALRLAPTMSIADFAVVADILDEPSYFLHYLAERERIQKNLEIFGDELDYLGLYLETGFNIAALYEGGIRLAITGMSQSVDHYYCSVDTGVNVRKPKLKIHPKLARLVEAIRFRSARHWATMALDILSIGNVEEQKALFAELEKLKGSVRKNYQNPEHLCSLVISPPIHRAACVIFYVYPEALASRRHDIAATLAGRAFEEQKRDRCILVGKKVEEWELPYHFVGIAVPPE